MKRVARWTGTLWPFGHDVHFPERRRGRRYLTLKNAAVAAVALVAAFILLSIWSAYRPAHSGASILDPHVTFSKPPSVVREPLAIVNEGWAHEGSSADSMLIDPGKAPTAPVPVAPSSTSADQQKSIEPRESQLGKGQRIMISGGSEGVHLHIETAPAPVPEQPQPSRLPQSR